MKTILVNTYHYKIEPTEDANREGKKKRSVIYEISVKLTNAIEEEQYLCCGVKRNERKKKIIYKIHRRRNFVNKHGIPILKYRTNEVVQEED